LGTWGEGKLRGFLKMDQKVKFCCTKKGEEDGGTERSFSRLSFTENKANYRKIAFLFRKSG